MKAFAFFVPLAVLTAAAPAFAVDFDSDKLAGIDAQTGAIQLDNGHQYTVTDKSQLIGAMPGTPVLVTFEGKKAVGFTEDPSQFDGSSGVPTQ